MEILIAALYIAASSIVGAVAVAVGVYFGLRYFFKKSVLRATLVLPEGLCPFLSGRAADVEKEYPEEAEDTL